MIPLWLNSSYKSNFTHLFLLGWSAFSGKTWSNTKTLDSPASLHSNPDQWLLPQLTSHHSQVRPHNLNVNQPFCSQFWTHSYFGLAHLLYLRIAVPSCQRLLPMPILFNIPFLKTPVVPVKSVNFELLSPGFCLSVRFIVTPFMVTTFSSWLKSALKSLPVC